MYEWKGKYHVTDLADKMKYSDINNWKRWNIKFKTFGEIWNKNIIICILNNIYYNEYYINNNSIYSLY